MLNNKIIIKIFFFKNFLISIFKNIFLVQRKVGREVNPFGQKGGAGGEITQKGKWTTFHSFELKRFIADHARRIPVETALMRSISSLRDVTYRSELFGGGKYL